jgi:tryptophanyl-tRNA synthetase
MSSNSIKKTRVLSGMQSSGVLHLGNYLGGIKNWQNMMSLNPDYEFLFMIASLHSLTTVNDKAILEDNIKKSIACYLACGLKMENVTIFDQSLIQEHTYLAWILLCNTPIGWLNRMTQYKDKSSNKDSESINTGLFTYPCLMAADILLYDAKFVPVGDDQRQHIEITRDIAIKFNNKYGHDIFTIPEAIMLPNSVRIKSLSNGLKKMSKSDSDSLSCIYLNDENDVIVDKIKRAKTDSIREIYYNAEERPEISNLLSIFSTLSGRSIENISNSYDGSQSFKKALTEVIVETISPIREKIKYYLQNIKSIEDVVKVDSSYAKNIAREKVKNISNAIGISSTL